jgi:U3 small nucleolar RNA-associated protein 14
MARKITGGSRVPFSASSESAASKGKGKGKFTRDRANRASKNDPSNAYTYEQALPKRHRTSEQQNSLTYEESKAGPSSPRRKKGEDDEEDDEELEMEERIRKLQMMIASDAPGQVDEDSEESEVDSDQAWESDGSDEERWGDVFRDLRKGKSKSQKAKGKEVVLKVSPIDGNRQRYELIRSLQSS